MRVSFYGRLADDFGPDIDMDLALPCTVGDVRRHLAKLQPASGFVDSRIRACVDGGIADDGFVVREEMTVEFLAPVSGG